MHKDFFLSLTCLESQTAELLLLHSARKQSGALVPLYTVKKNLSSALLSAAEIEIFVKDS